MAAHLQVKINFLLLTFLFLNSVVAQPVPRLSSQTEWRALLELRSSLGISAKYWRKKANPCLNWTGIDCKNGHVTMINLSRLRRSIEGKLNPGFSVDSLPKFPLLSTFNSSGFLLRGPIPDWFGQKLSNLEVLDLRSSSIYGSLPSSIGSLSRLRSLCLSNNSIAGDIPSTLDNLLSLSVLDLSQNLLTGQIPSGISALRNLSKLDLSSNFLSGGLPVYLGSLSRLKVLNLSNNSLSSSIPRQLGNLSELIELDLGFNSLFGSLPQELEGLTSLRKMLIGNNELGGSLFDGLFQKLTRLEYLDVSGNNLTGLFPNHTASSFNVDNVVFNFSNNLFYGNLNFSIFGKPRTVDVSSNYFVGSSAPNNNTGISILLSNNCFSTLTGQRNFEACSKFYAERGILFEPPSVLQPTKSRKRLAYVMMGVFGGLGFVVFLTGMLLLLRRCNNGSPNDQRQNPNVRPAHEGGVEKVFTGLSGIGESFTYEQMLLATCNFNTKNLIKRGHSGDIFLGILESVQHPIVVKRVDFHYIRKESFMSELELFSKVHHPRLVTLLGHCFEDANDKLLVYKYMPNGDLSNALYKLTNAEEDLQSMDWITRLKIAIGAAEALSYLHHECTPPVVHGDIQASSILLDDEYEVRLGSFSEVYAPGTHNHQNMVTRLLRTPPGTSGKRPSGKSSLLHENQLTCAYDVYCFGKVLLQLVTGISTLNDGDAKQWLENTLPLISIYEKELVIKIIDQSLIIDEDLLEEVWAVAVVAKSCLNRKASRRPSMRHVVKALENPFKVVRDENFSSGRLRTASWTAAVFGSWHLSSSQSSNDSNQTNREIIIGGLRQSERVGSRRSSSGTNDHSSSHKRSSSDVFPEPAEKQDVEAAMSY